MKIWLFLDSRANGGIESHVATLAKSLADAKQDVTVAFWQNYGHAHPMVKELNDTAIKCLVFHGSLIEFLRQVKKAPPQVLHAHGYKASLISRLCKQLGGYRQVSSFHAGEVQGGMVGIYDMLDRYTARFSDACIGISQEISERIKAPNQLLRNFVVPPKVANGLNGSDEIAFVGRLSEEKAPERFVELARRFPGQRFAVYGDGPLANEMRSQAPENVHFYGMVPSMKPFWSRIALICMPSRYEGLPMAALEAMAHGVVVMASPVGELPSLIQSGRNGWLIEGGSLPRWQQQLSNWLGLSAEKRRLMALSARETIEQSYSPSSQLTRFLTLYQGH